MAFSRALCCAFLVFSVALACAEVSISDFSGVWRTYTDVSHVNILTPQGPALVCRDTLSPGCEAEITQIQETFTFNGTTFSLDVRDRVGITTVEASAAAHPQCAKDGIYPFERVVTVPPSQITDYNAMDGRMHFIDPRRPDEINCVFLRYRTGENGPYIDATVVVLYKGSVPNVFALGLSYRCDLLSETCSVSVNDKRELDLALQASFKLACIGGDCLNAVGAASPSASHAPTESSDDL